MASNRDERPTEFGGRPGLIQRASDGHVLTEAEKLMLMKQIDPMDADTPPPDGV